MVENLGVAAGIASLALSVQKLFPLPVFVADIFASPCRPRWGRVGSVISELGMVENMGVAAETAWPALSVQKLFLLLFSTCRFLRLIGMKPK